MALFQWRSGWDPLRDLERQVDHLLETMRLPLPGIRYERQFPPVNLFELPDEFLLTARVPGVAPDSLELTVNQGVLSLRGSRGAPAGGLEERFRRHERYWGAWQRSFSLPERIDEQRVAADFNDGILKVHLPKVGVASPRQIPVANGGDASIANVVSPIRNSDVWPSSSGDVQSLGQDFTAQGGTS